MPTQKEQFIIDILKAAELDWIEKKDEIEKALIEEGFEGPQITITLQIIRDMHMDVAKAYLNGYREGQEISAECVKHAAELYKNTPPTTNVYKLLKIISEELTNA